MFAEMSFAAAEEFVEVFRNQEDNWNDQNLQFSGY
jgi:hypothetical protein